MRRAVTPAATLAHMTQLIMPQHANSLGITFGGQVRSLLAHDFKLSCGTHAQSCPCLTSGCPS